VYRYLQLTGRIENPAVFKECHNAASRC
jgi:hypothetical protein